MELTLNEEEARILKHVLDEYMPQLREEVANTERYELRKQMQQYEAVIKGLMERVDRLVPAAR